MFSAISNLSPGEVDYLTTSCQRNIRMDGRTRIQIRPYTLDVNVIPTASGSARICIESANILAVVKLDVGTIKPSDSPSALVNTSVDIKNPNIDRTLLVPLVSSLATEIQNFILQTELIKSNLLIIVPQQQAWILSIDIVVFSSCGNIFDYALLATRAALATATIPALRVYRKINVISSEITEYNVELIPGSTVPIGIWDKHFPLPLSLCILNNTIIVDPTEEETCIGSRYLIGFDRQGNVIGHTKVGISGVSPILFQNSLEIAQDIGTSIYQYYLTALSKAIEKDGKMATIMKILFTKLGPNSPLPNGFSFDPEDIYKKNKIASKTLGGSLQSTMNDKIPTTEDELLKILEGDDDNDNDGSESD